METDFPPGIAQCRFCLDEAPISELISPCQCTGTGSFVHEECLRRWQLKVVCTPDDTRASICQACRSPYTLPPPPVPARRSGGGLGGEELPTPVFEQITTNPSFFERSEHGGSGGGGGGGGILGGGLRQRLKDCMRPGCLVLRTPGAPETLISAEHWQQSVFLIGGLWPRQGQGQSDALIGVNLVGTALGGHRGGGGSSGSGEQQQQQHYPATSTTTEAQNLLWGLPIRTRRGGPCQQRRFLVLVAFSGALSAELPHLVRLVLPAEPTSESSYSSGRGPGPAASPPCCSGLLFGEPQDVLPVLRREAGIQILKAVAFQGHAVWSSTQLLSEVMRGDWGLVRANGSDLLMGLSVDERAAHWRQLWHSKDPLRASEGTKICTVS